MSSMVIIETGNFDVFWECSTCKTQHKATSTFEKSKNCPKCGEPIENWLGFDNYDDEENQ